MYCIENEYDEIIGGITMKEKIYIVMPVYNEEKNIEKVVRQWYKMLEYGNEESRLVIADSGSEDKSHKILIRLKNEYPKLDVLSNCEKEHGPKLMYLYDWSIKKGANWVFQTDSDGQTDPDEFEEFWKERKRYDVIIGKRLVREDGKSRAFVENVVCFLLKIYFGVNVPDANAPFRLMRTDVMKKYLKNLPNNYNLPNIMLTTYCMYYNEKVIFKEITFKPRQGGVNSINIPKIIKIGWNALKDFKNFKKEMKR